MFIYFDLKTKEIFATREDGIDFPAKGTIGVDYGKEEVIDYVQGLYTVDDSTSPITLIPITEG